MAENDRKRFSLISEGTRKFFSAAAEIEEFSLWDRIHGYVYIRWPYHYIGIGKGEHPIAKKLAWLIRLLFPPQETPPAPKPHSLNMATGTIADGYHGKAMPLATAKQLVTINQPVRVPDLEQVIPYVRARSIILENPEHIIAIGLPLPPVCRESLLPDGCVPDRGGTLHQLCVAAPSRAFPLDQPG